MNLPLTLSITTIVALLVGGITTYAYQKRRSAKKIGALETQNNAVSSEIERARQELRDGSGELAKLRESQNALQEKVTVLTSEKAAAETTATRVPNLESDLRSLREQLTAEKTTSTELSTRLQEQQSAMEEKVAFLNKAKETLTTEFENLGQKIFEEKTSRFTKQNQDNLQNLINPVREQIKDFQKRVNDVYDSDSKDRSVLREIVTNLSNMNQQLSTDANNLTKALKGESKTQGNWGEVILERILEQSGLKKGQQYDTQAHHVNTEGERFYPDIVIHLPEDKDIIIDSKVSLTAYERYVTTEDESEKRQALRDHVQSVRNHIKSLERKDYTDLVNVKTLGYVLMFIPIEPAFILAGDEDPSLFSGAASQSVFPVVPSTLMITLKTINAMWQLESQNRNAEQIASQAAALYDKLAGFLESFDKIGERLGQAQESWTAARNQLASGRGNLIGKAEKFRQLGVNPKKQLPEDLVEAAQTKTAAVSPAPLEDHGLDEDTTT